MRRCAGVSSDVTSQTLLDVSVSVDEDMFLGSNVVSTYDLRPRSFAFKDAASFVPTLRSSGPVSVSPLPGDPSQAARRPAPGASLSGPCVRRSMDEIETPGSCRNRPRPANCYEPLAFSSSTFASAARFAASMERNELAGM